MSLFLVPVIPMFLFITSQPYLILSLPYVAFPYPSHSVASYIPIRIVSTKETLIIMLPLGSTSISPDFFPQKSSIFHHFPPVPLEFFHQQTCPRLGFLQPQPPGIFGLGLAGLAVGRGRCLGQGAAPPGQVPASVKDGGGETMWRITLW